MLSFNFLTPIFFFKQMDESGFYFKHNGLTGPNIYQLDSSS